MKGHCNTKGHSDNPHRRRQSCRNWQGVHSFPIDAFPRQEEEKQEMLPVISSVPVEEEGK